MTIDLHSGLAVAMSPGMASIVARLGLISKEVLVLVLPLPGLIVFSSGGDIWTMTSIGALPRQLTSGGDIDHGPKWSPDGNRIAFTRYFGSAQSDVYVMNVDGSGLTRLTFNLGDDEFPAWSPDGTMIGFLHDQFEPAEPDPMRHGLHAMLSDGTSSRLVAPGGGHFDWVDSKRLVHAHRAGIKTRIGLSMADGTGTLELSGLASSDETGDWSPQWSPDVTKLVFTRKSLGADEDIMLMNVDGTGKSPIALTPEPERIPNWSPDGTMIAYARGYAPDQRIWVMKADGTGKTQVTFGPGSDGDQMAYKGGTDDLGWSRNGKALVFTRFLSRPDVYVIRANGTGLTNLTAALPDGGSEPEWQP